MSKQVDEKVVSMQFDNKQFEQGVKTSMSTLDKLKSKLHFDGAEQGFKKISESASNVKFTGLISGLENVTHKFSALDAVSFTVMQNITNRALQLGKNLVNAVTFQPVTDGFKEYETQMNAVQTILANTQKEGTNVKIVNKYLDELNHYADMTIYNFTEMTRNIGTFTAAGVKLETSVNAIKGIANLAAVSGSTSQQASTAMYQLSQAIAAGTVKLMDWNSVVNAGMGGQVFQDALIRTSENLKTGAKAAIEAEGSFRESLKDGWLTTEVLTETLRQFQLNVETTKDYNNAMKELVAQGYTQEQAKEIADMAKTASEAATKVKTFTQLIDTLKEALGSGWTKTWQLVIGDFEDARVLWTEVSDVLSNMINGASDARNTFVEAVMGSPLGKFAETLKNVSGATEEMIQVTKDYGDVVDKIINGSFGNGKKRFDALTEAGYDWAYAQNLVNERLGVSVKHTTDYTEAQTELEKSTTRTIEELTQMTAQQLLSAGYTTEQVTALRELAKQSEKTGIPINDLAKDLDQLSGRRLLIDSFRNIGSNLVKVFTSIGNAWNQTFKKMDPNDVYDLISAFHKLTERLSINDEQVDKLERTFKGLFAIIDLITTFVGGGFKLAFKVASKVLSYFNLDVLDVTATIGDAIVSFRDFVENNALVDKAIEALCEGLKIAAKSAKEFYEIFKQLPIVQKSLQKLSQMDLSDIGENILNGINNGLLSKSDSIIETIKSIAFKFIDTFKNIFGIHSPSTVFCEFGKFIIEGLVNGFQTASTGMFNFLDSMTGTILDKVGGVQWSTVLAGGASVALIATVKKLADAFSVLASPIKGINSLFGNLNNILAASAKPIAKAIKSVSKVLKSFAHVLDSIALDVSAKAFLKLAIAIGILVASLIALTFVDEDKLKTAITYLVILAGILAGLSVAAGLFAKSTVSLSKVGASINGIGLTLLSIAGAVLLMMTVFKMASEIDSANIQQAQDVMALMIGALIVMVGSMTLISSKAPIGGFKGLGSSLLKMTAALLLMVGVFKLAGMLSANDMINGTYILELFIVYMSAFSLSAAVTKEAGKSALAMSASLLLVTLAMAALVGVFKLASTLTDKDISHGIGLAAGTLVFMTALQLIGMIPSKGFSSLSKTLLAVSASMLLLVTTMKIAGTMSPKEMVKGGLCVLALLGVMSLMMIVVKAFGSEAPKMAATLMGISVAIGVLAMVAVALSFVKTEGLAKGILAVAALSLIMSGLMLASKFVSGDAKVSLIAMVAAVAVLAAAVIVLSFIEPSKLIAPVAALSVLMVMFGTMAIMASTVQSALGAMIMLTVVIAVLTGALYLLSTQDYKNILASAAGITLVLAALAGMMVAMATLGAAAATAIPAVLTLGILLAGVALAFYALRNLDGDNTLKVALSLSVTLLTLAAVCALMAVVGAAAIPAIAGMGVLILLAASITSFMVLIGEIMTAMPSLETFLDKGLAVLGKVGEGIGNFLGNIVGGFLESASSKLPAVADNLSDFMDRLSPFIDGVNSFTSDSAKAIKDLAAAILVITAAELVSGIARFIGGKSSLDNFVNQLVPFGKAMVEYGNTVKDIDSASITRSATAGKALAGMASSLPSTGGLLQKILGEKDMESFAKSLKKFGEAMVDYAIEVADLNTKAIEDSVPAGKSLTELADTIPRQNGVLQTILGKKDMSSFADSLVAFGKAMVDYSTSVNGLDFKVIDESAKAAKSLTNMADTIPRTDGWFQKILGQKDMTAFGESIKSFGEALNDFSKSIQYINTERFADVADCAMSLTDICNALPETGFLSGKMSFEDFGVAINAFAASMKDFYDNINAIDLSALPNVVVSVDMLTKMLLSMNDLNTDGVNAFVDSMENLGKAGVEEVVSALEHAGPDIYAAADSLFQNFANALNTKTETLKNSFINIISNAISAVEKDNTAFYSIGNKLMLNLASGITNGSTNLTGSVYTVMTKCKTVADKNKYLFVNAGSNIAGSLESGFKQSQGRVTTAISSLLATLVSSINSKKPAFYSGSSELITSMSSGMNDNAGKVTYALNALITTCLGIVNGDAYPKFYEAGSNCVSGFANGISENTFKAAATARAMAKAAYEAAMRELDEHSPSKKFEKIGNYVSEGFAIGIERESKLSEDATTLMARTAVDSAESILSTLSGSLSAKLDTSPVITPVLDMSNINNAGLQLNTGLSLSFTDPVNNLNNAILRAQQEIIRSNDQVIGAIDGLRGDVASLAENGFPEIGLYVSAEKLASSIAKPMDKQLNILSSRRAY